MIVSARLIGHTDEQLLELLEGNIPQHIAEDAILNVLSLRRDVRELIEEMGELRDRLRP